MLPRPDLVHQLVADETLLTKQRENLGLEQLAHGLHIDDRSGLEIAVRQESSTGHLDSMHMRLKVPCWMLREEAAQFALSSQQAVLSATALLEVYGLIESFPAGQKGV